MNTGSALYLGNIEHRRFSPRKNSFNYLVCYYFLELKEIPNLFRVPLIFTHNKPGLLSFWDKDYLSEENIKTLILQQTQKVFSGSIRLLTNISYFGFCFNPVSFYYCYAEDGTTLQFIVSQITNTPWGEKHPQVFTIDQHKQTFVFRKDFHVSPFMPMDIDYTWVFHRPDKELYVLMQNRKPGEKEIIFDSTLELSRKPLTASNVIKAFLVFPLVTFKTMLAIYYQAFKLFIKRVPFYTHPSKEKVYDNSNIT